jgi:hypothetical protein
MYVVVSKMFRRNFATQESHKEDMICSGEIECRHLNDAMAIEQALKEVTGQDVRQEVDVFMVAYDAKNRRILLSLDGLTRLHRVLERDLNDITAPAMAAE